MRSLQKSQSGQVLAEAIVVLMALVILLGAIHVTNRWQFDWLRQWLDVQVAADGAMAEHVVRTEKISQSSGSVDRFRSWVLADYQIGQQRWQRYEGKGRFAQVAWRPVGAGQASSDQAVVQQLANAPRLWRRAELKSLAAVLPLSPTLQAVEMPWRRAGASIDWLNRWKGTTPSAYLKSAW